MTRFLLASLVAGIAATISLADPPSVPIAMPSWGASGSPSANPLPSSPTVPHPTQIEGIYDDGDCCQRCGLLRRIASLWSGQRYAYVDPSACCTASTCTTPVYCTRECGRVCVGERCHRFGVGRFVDRDERECRWPRLACLKRWLCWRPIKDSEPHCVAAPYQTPIRYYFQAEADTCPNGNCGGGYCATSNGRGGRRAAGAYVSGNGDDANNSGDGEYVSARRGLSGGLGSRLHTGALAGGGLGSRGGHCRDGEQCCLTGTPFQGNLRFAKDERPEALPIDASKPYESPGNSHDQQRYIKQDTPPSPVIQASASR